VVRVCNRCKKGGGVEGVCNRCKKKGCGSCSCCEWWWEEEGCGGGDGGERPFSVCPVEPTSTTVKEKGFLVLVL